MDTAMQSSATADGVATGTPTTAPPAQLTSAPLIDTPLARTPLTGAPACPKCGGRMWDNRASKRNPRAPDFKCRQRFCDGVLWPGQHHAATPIITARPPQPDSADDEGAIAATATATAPDPNGASGPGRRARLRRCYLDLAEFVLLEVRPNYEAAGVPCRDATVAAITATLFIAACHREGD